MAKFRYTVINPQNQQLTGTINAPDIKLARSELNNLGFSVLKIDEINEEEKEAELAANLITFDFEAFDKAEIIQRIPLHVPR